MDQIAPHNRKKIPLYLVILTVFIDLIGFGLIIPVLPTYAQDLHASPTVVGLLIASYSFMQFLLTPVWGRLSDKVGRRPILLLSLAASAVGYIIWGFASSLAMLFVARLVAGAGNANIAVAQAYVADVTTKEERAFGMGLVGAAFGLGFVLGPALGGLIVSHGLNTLGFAAAALSLVDLVFTYFFVPEPPRHNPEASERYSLRREFYLKTLSAPDMRASLAIFLISTFAFANMEATLVLLTRAQFSFTAAENAMMFTYIGVLIVVVQGGLVGRLSARVSEKTMVSVGALLVAVALLLIPATADIHVLFLALALLALGSGISTPANQSLLSRLAGDGRVGGVLGVGQSLSTLGRILGPVVGGLAFEYLGFRSPYMIGSLAMLLAFGLSMKLPANGEVKAGAGKMNIELD